MKYIGIIMNEKMRGDYLVMIQDFHKAPCQETPALPQYYVCTAMYTIQTGDTLYSISRKYNVPVSVLMEANSITNPYDLQIGQQICIPAKNFIENIQCDGIIHVIKAGDTPYLLAKHYTVSLDSLLEANPGIDPHNLVIGSELCIPNAKIIPDRPQEPGPQAEPSPEPVPPAQQIPRTQPIPVPKPEPMPAPVPVPAPIPAPVPAPIPAPAPAPAPAPVPVPIPAPAPVPVPAPIPIPIPLPPSPPEVIPEPEAEGNGLCLNGSYTVKEGDTLYMIAKNNNITLDELVRANPSLDFYNLEIGMILCVPLLHKMDSRINIYRVILDDNLDKICNKFQVQPRNLMKANPDLTIMDYSIPGTKVCIPNI